MTELESLRLEYRRVGDRVRNIGHRGSLFDPELLRLQAREIEIVDRLRDLGVAPDVLVAA